MLFKYTLKTAYNGLQTNRSRSALTILGIVIGITAIILIMSLGQGAQNLILGQIQVMGSKTIAIHPGRQPKGPTDFAQMFMDSLKEKDVEELKKKINVPNLETIMPLVYGSETGTYKGDTYKLTIFGASEWLAPMFDIYPSDGEFITPEDIKNKSDVVVIGSKVKDELFGNSNTVGEKIKIKNRSFKVVGVLPKKRQVSFMNFDEVAIVPYSTAQQYIFGIKHYHEIVVEADSENNMPRMAEDITATLRASHDISDPLKDDFYLQTQQDLANRISTVTDILTMFLVAVAAISLIVGGIGIMNIMLVSVTERTREIGLRKAIGATEKDVLRQFLLEAVILTSVGGVIGIGLGAVFSFIASIILSKGLGLDWGFSFPFFAALLGLFVASSVGLIFGLYPARQAAKKSPMETLRYE
ncbi:MAG: ABC transporter permease [Patescibacteria group bacterium]|nr:ABC transporter permease [Patescibacteria group bacterium]